MSEREPNAEAVPQAAEASAAGLGPEPPSRSESAGRLVENYATGVAAAEAKVAAAIGPEAADRWKRASIASAQRYAHNYARHRTECPSCGRPFAA